MYRLTGKYYKYNSASFYLKGDGAEDFLNRFTTNNLNKLSYGQYQYSILTDYNGHIIDLLLIFKLDEGLLIVGSLERFNDVTNHLERYILSEDVRIESSKFDKSIILFNTSDNKDFNNIINNSFEMSEDIIIFKDALFNGHIHLIYFNPKDIIEENAELMTFEEFEYFRITNLIPYSINELNDKVIPLECNLNDFISFDKGCYLGQEVISRIYSQDKLPKRMFLFKSEYEILSGDKIFIRNLDDENFIECGFISSAIKRYNEFYALGFIRTKNFNTNNIYYLIKENKFTELKLIK